ncbi:MAG: carbohydrate ABC transporter permease [Bacillota bacterium]
MFFERYAGKKDGAIRDYDVSSFRVKVMIIIIMLLCAAIAFICLFPAIWVFMASFKDIKEFKTNVTIFPSKLNFSLFIKTWNELKFLHYYLNSLILVAGSAVCAIIFNGLIAYSLGILKPKGHKAIYGLVVWSLLIPPTTSMVALFVNINRVGLNKSFLPLWLAYGANAFYTVLFKQFFESMPRELFEAAKLDGCGVLQMFRLIILPLSRPIIMVVAIFSINAAWSDFLLPYLVLSGSGMETVMIALFKFRNANTPFVDVLRAVFFSMVPPTVLFMLFQRQIINGAAIGAIKE